MSPLEKLYAAQIRSLLITADGQVLENPDATGRIVLAGSFNPLHRGHRRLLAAAERITGQTGAYEISIQNVDKPDLPVDELELRLSAFEGKSDVFITRAALFLDKAIAMPGAWFVIGIDTAERLVDDSYYPDRDASAALMKLRERDVRFAVAGRLAGDGSFASLNSLVIPDEFAEMFIDIPESEFREDVSSTELRSARRR